MYVYKSIHKYVYIIHVYIYIYIYIYIYMFSSFFFDAGGPRGGPRCSLLLRARAASGRQSLAPVAMAGAIRRPPCRDVISYHVVRVLMQ